MLFDEIDVGQFGLIISAGSEMSARGRISEVTSLETGFVSRIVVQEGDKPMFHYFHPDHDCLMLDSYTSNGELYLPKETPIGAHRWSCLGFGMQFYWDQHIPAWFVHRLHR